MVHLKLNRRKYLDKQTVGTLAVYKDNLFLFSLSTLEQDWNNNITSNSCIPRGHYIVEPHNSISHPNTFILRGTEPRTSILIHIGNKYSHTEGCILVGLIHDDIDNDGYVDVKYSTEAMNKLRNALAGEAIIEISIT